MRSTLWRTCRVLANETRLELFRTLLGSKALAVSDLAEKTGISLSLASIQLRSLNTRGLISARTVGPWVFYSADPSQWVENAAAIVNAIRASCECGVQNRELIRTATAFTHQRRILIARCLNSGQKTFPELAASTHISAMALYRHLEKLSVRRIVEKNKEHYRLAEPEDSLGKTLLDIARS